MKKLPEVSMFAHGEKVSCLCAMLGKIVRTYLEYFLFYGGVLAMHTSYARWSPRVERVDERSRSERHDGEINRKI